MYMYTYIYTYLFTHIKESTAYFGKVSLFRLVILFSFLNSNLNLNFDSIFQFEISVSILILELIFSMYLSDLFFFPSGVPAFPSPAPLAHPHTRLHSHKHP